MAGWVYGPSVSTLAAGRETGGLRRCALARTDCRGCDNIRTVSRHDVDLMSHECQLARMAEPSLQLRDRRAPEEYGVGVGYVPRCPRHRSSVDTACTTRILGYRGGQSLCWGIEKGKSAMWA